MRIDQAGAHPEAVAAGAAHLTDRTRSLAATDAVDACPLLAVLMLAARKAESDRSRPAVRRRPVLARDIHGTVFVRHIRRAVGRRIRGRAGIGRHLVRVRLSSVDTDRTADLTD